MHTLRFDNRFIRELPADPESSGRRRQVHGALYSLVTPTPVASPQLIAYSREVATLLGLSALEVESPEFAEVFGGNTQWEGMQPFAANYGGHQFGNWAGQLGDGRAITLGEVINAQNQRWELQLKGAGPTPYSRGADGRAVLRSSVREFLCSEAMHHLGVPTTRALSLVLTGDQVERDMFYDGRAKLEAGAIVCRVAPSFIRFGNFELPSSRGDIPLLQRLVDFTIARDFADWHMSRSALSGSELYAAWFSEVCERTAHLLAHWMRVGFVHGVMNTDNMSILGLTIDYGPYGWVDNLDFGWTPNTTDAQGRRYRFGQQPQIALWNLGRLASALAPLLETHDVLEVGLQRYVETYTGADRANTAAKLGLRACEDEDVEMMRSLQGLLQEAEVDMTLWFRALSNVDIHIDRPPTLRPFEAAFYDEAKRAQWEPQLLEWLTQYVARIRRDEVPPNLRQEQMNAANPRYVLRNYLAQEAIDRAEQGDYGGIHDLLEVLRHPYTDQPGRDLYAQRRPEWARNKPGSSMLSCSS